MSRDEQFDHGMEALIDLGLFAKRKIGDKTGIGMTKMCKELLKKTLFENRGQRPTTIIELSLRKVDPTIEYGNIEILTALIASYMEACAFEDAKKHMMSS